MKKGSEGERHQRKKFQDRKKKILKFFCFLNRKKIYKKFSHFFSAFKNKIFPEHSKEIDSFVQPEAG